MTSRPFSRPGSSRSGARAVGLLAVLPLVCLGPPATMAAAPAGAAAPSTAECARAFDRGDYPGAIALARQRLAAAPADTSALVVMARAEAALGRFEAAYQGFRKVLAREPRNTDALYYLAILGGVLAQAEYDRLLSLAPDSARAHQLLGDLHQAQERPTDAETEYKAGLAGAPASLDLLIALGDLTRHQARFEEALGYYERAVKVSPRRYEALYGLGVARSYLRDYAPAIAAFREALAVDPSSAPAHLALGHALLQSGQPGPALPELEKAAALEPRMRQAHYLLGRAYTALGRSREAAAVFEKVRSLVQGGNLDDEAARQSVDPLGQAKPAPLPSPESR